MFIEIFLGIIVFVLIAWSLCRKPSGLPPGPWGVPLFGYFPLSGKFVTELLGDLHQKYGDIYVWRLGWFVQLFVHDYKQCKQIFNNPDFLERPDGQAFKLDNPEALGVFSSRGIIWATNRRFSLHQLKDLGMGKSSLVGAIHEQGEMLLDAIRKDAGKARPITPTVNTAIVNVIWKMIANMHFKSNDDIQMALQELIYVLNTTLVAAAVGDALPWVNYILPSFITRKLFKLDHFYKAANDFLQYFEEIIKDHQNNLDVTNPKDLIDAYLIEMIEMQESKNNAEENKEHNNLRSIEDLKFLVFDLFFAGSDTTTNTLQWIILYMATYPQIQLKLQQEIDQVLDKGTMAYLEDKSRLPYTQAVINEVIRKSSFINIGVPVIASRDTVFAGYKIPKGTAVMSATHHIHHDPRYWNEPDQFQPDRWLDSEGNFVMKKEGFIPFGIGKRNCIGESLARMELLIFTTAIFQNFTVEPPADILVDLNPDVDIQFGHRPYTQDVLFTIRE